MKTVGILDEELKERLYLFTSFLEERVWAFRAMAGVNGIDNEIRQSYELVAANHQVVLNKLYELIPGLRREERIAIKG